MADGQVSSIDTTTAPGIARPAPSVPTRRATRAPRTFWRDTFDSLRQQKGALIGLGLIALVVVAAIVGTIAIPDTANRSNLSQRLNSTCPACAPTRSRRARARRTRRISRRPYAAGTACRRSSIVAVDSCGGGFQGGRRGDRAARERRTAASSGASARTSSRPGSRRCSIDLMERGFVSALATNGAGVIHDFEVALSGATSEDVDEALGPGRFGMAEETGALLNAAINDGVRAGSGSARRWRSGCARSQPPHASLSVARCRRAARDSGHRPRRHRHRHHSHAPGRVRRGARRRQPARFPLFCLERRAAGRRRVPELRVGGGAAGGVSQGRRPGAQPRRLARRPHHRESRFRAPLPRRRPTWSRGQSPASARAIRWSATTKS